MKNNFYIYLLVAFIVTFLIRCLPLTILNRRIKNKYIKTFLYYVPYVTLATMVFLAIIQESSIPLYGYIVLIIGIVASYKQLGLFKVTTICCLVSLILEVLF